MHSQSTSTRTYIATILAGKAFQYFWSMVCLYVRFHIS